MGQTTRRGLVSLTMSQIAERAGGFRGPLRVGILDAIGRDRILPGDA
ncbi:hypothetical protein [Microbispora rosea]